MSMKACDECGSEVTADSDDSFGAAFLAHARQVHPDWSVFPDVAVTNYGEALLRLTGRRERLESIGSVKVELVTRERVDDFLAFFDHDAFAGNPAWAACYCTEPHDHVRGQRPDEMLPEPWQTNRERMVSLLDAGKAHGYLAYVDGRPAGWVNASIRAACALYRLGDEAKPANDDVVSVVCFVIAPPYRRHGLADALLQRVIEDAPDRGVSWVEAYPPTVARTDDSGNFRGPPALLERHGFEAAGRDGRNTVMRRPV